MSARINVIALTLAVSSSLALASGVDWPRFRGSNGSGVAEASDLPVEFGPKVNVVWKLRLPAGTSSPILTDDRIFITGFENENLITFCLHRTTGKILWRRELVRPRSEKLHPLNSPASSTPATDGENVYAFFGDFGLISYGSDGNERWRMPLGPFSNLHGMGASPLLIGDKLILLCDQDTNSFLLALQKDTGKVLWKTERPEAVHGFSTPTIFRPKDGPPQIIVPGSYQLSSYSADTGTKLWWVRGLTWQAKPGAVVSDDTIYATGWAPGADAGERQALPPFEEVLKEADKNGDGKISAEELPAKWKHSGSWAAIDLDHDNLLDARDWSFYRARRSSENVTMAVRPANAKGDLTDTHVIWKYDRAVPQVSSPLLYEGILYTIKDGGVFTSFDPRTGTVQKQARLPKAIDSYYASPVAADKKIVVVSETGKVSVLKAGREWESLAVNDMGEPCYATPAIAGNCIYLRTATTLYCFRK